MGALRTACADVLAGAFLWPTATTLAWALLRWTLSFDQAAREGVTELISQALLFEVVLRTARLVALVVHELSHLLVAYALLLPTARPRLLRGSSAEAAGLADDLGLPTSTRGSLLTKLSWQLVPGAPASGAFVALSPRASGALLAGRGPRAEVAVESAGLLVSVLLPFGVQALLCTWLPRLSVIASAAVAGSWLVAAGALLSDLPLSLPTGPRPPAGCFCCGNWGLLVPRAALEDGSDRRTSELFPAVCESLLLSVLDIVELRGAQAGGVNTFLSCVDGSVQSVRSRSLKSKRGHLGPTVFREFRKAMRNRWLKGVFCCRRLKPLQVVLAQGHSRFGTSSSPAVIETHPHQWLGHHKEAVWQVDSLGRWRRETRELCTTITHNGDFDGFVLYDKVVPNGSLGLWLARVLGFTNPAKGDSAKLAGMMDLLICQGMWVAAVRYAFVTEVLRHENEVFGWEAMGEGAGNAMPAKSVLAEWAEVFDSRFTANLEGDFFEPTPEAMSRLVQDIEHHFHPDKNGTSLQQLEFYGLVGDRITRFVHKACQNFFDMDMLSAVSTFFARADGTFGISVSCTLWPSSIVLAVKGQPISLAFDPQRPIVLWSSEPSSLSLGWPARDSGGLRTRAAKLRWDMLDSQGEAVELRIFEGGAAAAHADDMRSRKVPGMLKDVHYFSTLNPLAQHVKQNYHLLVRGVSLTSASVPLTQDRFWARAVVLQTPPPARRAKKNPVALDPVAQDLNDVPSVLLQVEDSWMDKSSLNWQSGKNFGQKLVALLTAKQQGLSSEDSIDVLVFGIESSLWLGRQFAADLKRLLPRLNVTALSSNWVLGMVQEAHGHVEPLDFAISSRSFRLTPGALVLGISHSGTTYPTVWAARALHAQMGSRVCMFAMSGVFDTVLANSIGQDLSHPKFTGVLFSTLAGVRPAEASTVATLAMHHTLSWLLYMSAGAVMAAFPTCASAKASESDKTEGKWKDVEGKLFNGMVIYIEGETWGLEGEEHDCGTFWATAISDTQKRLFHELPEGSLATYTATWQDGTLQIRCAEDKQPDADCDATWTLRRCGQAGDVPVISVKPTDVQDMLPLLRSLIPASEALCGVNKHGVAQKHISEVRQEVLKVGAYLASYLLEGWYGILLSAIYVYVTVTIGFPIARAAWEVIVNVAELDDEEYWVIALDYVVGHVDAHIFVFMGAILTVMHRYFTGRRLFTRFCARNVVIVESTANYKLLRAYVSKLRALAFRFTTFGVAGQNGADHFVHEMTHLTTSETIILAGRPDGRIGSLAATEAVNIMSLQQARYIAASPYTGVECISVGHNPWAKPGLFSRTVTLPTEHRPRFFTSELLNSTHGAHAPMDIMYGVATLARGDAAKASDRTTEAPFSWVRIEDINSRMSNRKQVGLAHAQNIIEDLVVEYADDLQINAANFHSQSVLTAESAAILCGSRSQPPRAATAPKGAIRNGMSGLVAMVSGPTKEKLAVPGSEVIRTDSSTRRTSSGLRTWSSSSSSPTVMLSASNIMATLRGRKMEDTIKQLRAARVAEQDSLKRSNQVSSSRLFQVQQAVFQAWALWALQQNRDREVGRVSQMLRQESDMHGASLPQVFAWRMREEYRRRRRQWMFDVSELSTSGPLSVSRCLGAWKDFVAETRRLAKQQAIIAFSPSKGLHQATEMLKHVSPSKTQVEELIRKHSPVKGYAATEATAKVAIRTLVSRVKIPEVVIGQHCRAAMARSDVQGKNVLADLRTMETLYETRIASAERLLAFFILFHAAVRPISRLWGLGFDMDRSESRLRVASTPAPVPFVEGGHDAVDSGMDELSIASIEESHIEV